MAKVIIKSERITPFGGIFPVREQFSRFVGPVIDKVLGLHAFTQLYKGIVPIEKGHSPDTKGTMC